jgi:hypothetical protein
VADLRVQFRGEPLLEHSQILTSLESGQAGGNPAEPPAESLGPRGRRRGPPDVGRGRGQEEPPVQAGRAAAGHHRSLPPCSPPLRTGTTRRTSRSSSASLTPTPSPTCARSARRWITAPERRVRSECFREVVQGARRIGRPQCSAKIEGLEEGVRWPSRPSSRHRDSSPRVARPVYSSGAPVVHHADDTLPAAHPTLPPLCYFRGPTGRFLARWSGPGGPAMRRNRPELLKMAGGG